MNRSQEKGPGPKSKALSKALTAVETANVTWLGDEFPVFWSSAQGVWVYDADGHDYIDMTSAFGVCALGHGHSQIKAALHQQVDTLIHGMGDVHPPSRKVDLLEKLANLVPIQNPRITLGTSGTMATEIALKAAHLYTGKEGLLCFKGGYHGLSAGSLRVIGHEKFKAPFLASLGPQAQVIDFPGAKGAPDVKSILKQVSQSLSKGVVGAVIIEPIQGRGGINVPPPGFLKELKKLCSDHNALLILDEIFTGLYRTGPSFACEQMGVKPDILLVGKALGGGLPIGACIGEKKVMDAFGPSPGEATHTETFLGHPLTMASACATLDLLTEGWIQERVEKGSAQLEKIIQARFNVLGEDLISIRGQGLMLGAEVATPTLCKKIVGAALKEGLIILGGGMHGDVVQFTPPLLIGEEELNEFDARLEKTLQRVLSEGV